MRPADRYMMHEVAVSDHGVTGETVVHVRLEILISLD